MAGSWLIASVFSELTMAMSSTIVAVCGSSSLTQAPHWPCCGKLEHRRHARKRLLSRGHAGDALAHADRRRQFLAVVVAQLRLVIEQVDVRRPAGHEKIDDALGLRAAKCRCDSSPCVLSAASTPAAKSRSLRSEARAAVPMPAAVRPNN